MKKIHSILLVGVVMLIAWAGVVISDTTFDWSGAAQSGTLTYTNLNLVNPTITDGSTTNKPIVGGDAIAQQVITSGTSTQGVAIAYGLVYSAAPKVVCTYQEDSGADVVIEVTTKNTTNFTMTATAAKNIDWIAVGLK